MSTNLSYYNNYTSGASESIKKIVYNEYRGRKSQKRKEVIREEKQKRHQEKRERQQMEEVATNSNYRDRAKELRELGYDRDYEGLLPENFAHLTEEELQLLGGDISRTHLVKGMDQALLQRRRDEIAKEEEEKRQKEEARRTMLLQTESYKTDMGRNIHSFLFDRERLLDTVNEMTPSREFFMKGRNTYAMRIQDSVDSVLYEIPNTIVHSKDECAKNASNVMAVASPSFLEMLGKSLLQSVGDVSKRRRRKEKQVVKAVDEDLDMFSDSCVSCKQS